MGADIIKTAIDDIVNLFKKKGSRETLEILGNVKDYKMNRHDFYDELNKMSYYNSFFRVRDELLEREIIAITQNNNGNKQKLISLTSRGVYLYTEMLKLNALINQNQ